MSSKKTKVEIVQDPELQYSYAYKITRAYRVPFYVPVIDVRDGETQRKIVKSILKNSNAQRGSRYIPTNYQNFLFRTEKDLVANESKETASNS